MSDIYTLMACGDRMRHMRASDLIKIMLDSNAASKFAAEFNEFKSAEAAMSVTEIQDYAAAEIDDRAPSLLDRNA